MAHDPPARTSQRTQPNCARRGPQSPFSIHLRRQDVQQGPDTHTTHTHNMTYTGLLINATGTCMHGRYHRAWFGRARPEHCMCTVSHAGDTVGNAAHTPHACVISPVLLSVWVSIHEHEQQHSISTPTSTRPRIGYGSSTHRWMLSGLFLPPLLPSLLPPGCWGEA